MRRNGGTYFPAKGQVEAKDLIRYGFKGALKGRTFIGDEYKGPVALTVHSVFALPQRLPKGDRRKIGDPHTFKPDGDNLIKLVKDALNGVGYKDDCQVFEAVSRKQWSDHNRTIVTLEYFQ